MCSFQQSRKIQTVLAEMLDAWISNHILHISTLTVLGRLTKGRFWELWPNSQARIAHRRMLPFETFPTTSKHQFGEMGLFGSQALSSISTAVLLQGWGIWKNIIMITKKSVRICFRHRKKTTTLVMSKESLAAKVKLIFGNSQKKNVQNRKLRINALIYPNSYTTHKSFI